jgi:hypothetical protein
MQNKREPQPAHLGSYLRVGFPLKYTIVYLLGLMQNKREPQPAHLGSYLRVGFPLKYTIVYQENDEGKKSSLLI